jgi:hypothetical protein
MVLSVLLSSAFALCERTKTENEMLYRSAEGVRRQQRTLYTFVE